jgi:excisionase family DNA binding protein
MTTDKLLITADDVAAILNVRRSTVYEWARMSYLPSVRLGRGTRRPLIRFEREAVLKWLSSRRESGRSSRCPDET